jgi:hypothetical protein
VQAEAELVEQPEGPAHRAAHQVQPEREQLLGQLLIRRYLQT